MRGFLRRHVVLVGVAVVVVLAVIGYLAVFVLWGEGSGSTGIG